MRNKIETKKHLSIRQGFHFTISVLITGTFLYFMLRDEGGDHFLDILQNVSSNGVILYVVLGTFGLVVRTLRYRLLLTCALGREGCPSTVRLLIVTAIRNVLTDFLPARLGEVAYIYVLSRYGVRAATGATTLGFCIVLDIVILFMLVLVFLLCGAAFVGSDQSTLSQLFDGNTFIAIAAIVALILLLIALIMLVPRVLQVCCRGLTKFAQSVSNRPALRRWVLWVEENVEHIAFDLDRIEHSGKLPHLALLTVLLRLTKYGSLYVLLLAVVSQWGLTFHNFNFGLTTVAFIIAEATASLPISGVMGFGAYETSWSLVFSLAQVELPYVDKVAFVVHIITQIKACSVGLVAMACFLWFEARRVRAESTR